MSFNKETFDVMVTFGVAMIGVLLMIWLLAVGTPYAAKFVDRLLGKKNTQSGKGAAPIPERVDGELNGSTQAESEYKVYDIYEGTPSEENKEKSDEED